MDNTALDPLILLLWQNSIEASIYIEKKIQPLGLTMHDVRAITVLKQHGSMTASELASRLGITNGAVTGSVNRLMRAGVATREVGGLDKRQRVISLQLSDLDSALGRIQSVAAELFNEYAADERMLLLQHYSMISERLKAIMDQERLEP